MNLGLCNGATKKKSIKIVDVKSRMKYGHHRTFQLKRRDPTPGTR